MNILEGFRCALRSLRRSSGFSAVAVATGFLFGVGSADPAIFAAVAAVPAFGGFAACAIPVRRAVAIEPLSTQREE